MGHKKKSSGIGQMMASKLAAKKKAPLTSSGVGQGIKAKLQAKKEAAAKPAVTE